MALHFNRGIKDGLLPWKTVMSFHPMLGHGEHDMLKGWMNDLLLISSQTPLLLHVENYALKKKRN